MYEEKEAALELQYDKKNAELEEDINRRRQELDVEKANFDKAKENFHTELKVRYNLIITYKSVKMNLKIKIKDCSRYNYPKTVYSVLTIVFCVVY